MLPNSQIANGKVINYTQAGFVAVPFDLWFDASSSIDVVRRIVNEEAERDPASTGRGREEHRLMLRIFERPAYAACSRVRRSHRP